MRYLLDVNALVALGLRKHEFYSRVSIWAHEVRKSAGDLMTCSITELGFLRTLAQAQLYGVSLSDAHELLLGMKTSPAMKLMFLVDTVDASQLLSWVKTARQTTDGHLLQLAQANGLLFATLDAGIPGAFLIPETRFG